ncbi:putative permease, DMT superfamily [Saccharomonospora marina XMU15]|uniref:Putative permease, DMT superfamily n=1 Tax=Saccharomonospora marina XMU15 TaxID=882083 RepID=H5X0Z3_9PSEU|nr:DMT family transporter [Saccharomonospora marina]EHR51993.1 putative permease, DMT superfamily [Saccharomonospora marina XMU15]
MSVSAARAARTRAGALNLLVAGVLWGTGGLAGSVLATRAHLHPLAVASYRLLLGGGFAVVLLWIIGGLRTLPRTRTVARRLLTAGALLALFQACYFASVTLTSVSIATMTTIGSAPVFVALGDAVLERRRPSNATVLSLAGALLGLVLLTWSPDGGGDRWRLAAGVVCALVSGLGFATLTLATRRQVEGLDPLRTTAFGLLLGGVLLLPLGLWTGMALPARLDVLAVAVYLGVVPTALAYLAYFRGLRRSQPVLAALAALLEPLTAALLAAVLLGERLGALGWCGAALLAGTIAVSYLRPRE